MVALQIRDVPDVVRDGLAELARARGQSMQAFLLWLVTEEARRAANIALLESFSARSDGTRLSSGEAQKILDRARSERDAQLSGFGPWEDSPA